MKTQYIMVEATLGNLSGSVSDSMRGCIIKYIKGYILCDNYSEDEFEEAVLQFMDDDSVNVEVV